MPLPSAVSRVAQAAALLVVSVLLVMRAATPPAVVPATAPPTGFSAERAMRHVRAIAERPHPSGSADIERVRGYLVAQLREMGLAPSIQDATGIGTRHRMSGRVQNILARLPGTGTSGRAVMLVSHYDSHGASPGAGDAASATAALLETMRALQAGEPLRHDVILLLTDGEEAGLLGAAAFAREHPWARDVEMILNFEARGTGGRVFMFETASGNLDAVRVLRRLPDVSAASLMVMVYRILPNDTDLSELMVLGKPAMNFAFIDGVERYHTAYDDVAHLDPRSVQHHGAQALALAREFGDGPLPRPATGDAVFFDIPFVGLVVYPKRWALPIALVALGLVVAVVVGLRRREERVMRGVAAGIAGALGATLLAAVGAALLARGIVLLHAATGWGGAPEWRGIYFGALAAFVIAVATAAWAFVRRWATATAAHAGGLVAWALLAVTVTVIAPGASYVFAWPLLAMASATLIIQHASIRVVHAAAALLSAGAVLVMLVPLVYLLGDALGASMAGAAAAALLAALGVWLVAAYLEVLTTPRRWLLPTAAMGLAAVLLVAGAVIVRPSRAFPTRSNIVREVSVNTAGAAALPDAEIVRDSVAAGQRHLTLLVRAPASAHRVQMSARARVAGAAIDGRIVDTTRYRRSAARWTMGYAAPPDSGFLVSLLVPAAEPITVELSARVAGVPAGVNAATERGGAHAVPSARGDATLLHRTLRL